MAIHGQPAASSQEQTHDTEEARDEKAELRAITLLGGVVLVVFVIGAVLGFGWSGWDPEADTLPYETGKLLVQATLAGGLAALIAYFVDILKRREARRRQQAAADAARAAAKLKFELDVLNRFLKRLDASYREVKTARRHLTAGFKKDHTGSVARDTLYQELDGLSVATQLDLEQLLKDADVLKLHVPELGDVELELDHMEKYLGKLWTEMERNVPDLGDPVTVGAGTKLKRITAFCQPLDRGTTTQKAPRQLAVQRRTR